MFACRSFTYSSSCESLSQGTLGNIIIMGNSEIKSINDQESIQHERLGTVRLSSKAGTPTLEDEEDEQFEMHLTRLVESQKEYKDWVKAMNQVSDSESRQVLLLPSTHIFEPKGMCGSSGVVKMSFDYYQFVLKTEIINRHTLRKDFLETEIWYLLYNIVRAGNKFELLKKKIGNIHPNNILINESGQIKVLSSVSLPREPNNYELLLEQQGARQVPVFLAPQELMHDLIQKGAYPSHVDSTLAEVFSIGLTILSSGTLEDADQVYSFSPIELRKERLSQLLRIFKDKYSDFLYQTVVNMVSLNPKERKRCSAIAASLNQYENQILDLEPFQVQNFRHPQPVYERHQPQQVHYIQGNPQHYQPVQQPVQHTAYYPSQPVAQYNQRPQGAYGQNPPRYIVDGGRQVNRFS